MAIALDLITHKTLILVKQIYKRAEVQSSLVHSDADRILSLISFDLANETLLKNAVAAVDSKVKEIPSDLHKLIQVADSVFDKASPSIPPVPDTIKIKRVRRIRNGAMHEAKYPTPNDISDCRTYTRDFLQQVILNVWNIDFASLRLTDLIKHTELKTFLTKAETALETDDFTEAVTQAKAAVNIAIGRVETVVVGTIPYSINAIVVADGKEQGSSPEVYQTFETIREIIAHSVIGIDFQSYMQFKRLTRSINVSYFGDGKIRAVISGHPPNADDATYVVNYAINVVIQIENLVGDIDKPFGLDRW